MDIASATRTVYWNIANPGWSYLVALVAFGVSGWGVYRRARVWRALGRPTPPLRDILARTGNVWRQAFRHERLVRDPVAGWMHASIAAGVALLFVGTLVVLVHVDFGVPVMRGWFYLVFQKLALTLAGVLLAAGCVIALVRRHVIRIPRLRSEPDRVAGPAQAWIAPTFLLVLVVQGFALQAIRLAANPDPHALWSPVGYAMSLTIAGAPAGTLAGLYATLWWIHLLTAAAWIAWLPFGKMLHIVTGPLNLYAAPVASLPRRPEPIDFDGPGPFGAARITDFRWKDLLDLDACTSCGRCEAACPAHAAGTPLSPRRLILDLRDHLHALAPALLRSPDARASAPPLVPDTISDAALWSCTTCGACVRECPVAIEHVPKIIELRRHRVMEETRLPATLETALKSIEDRAHPYKGAAGDRLEWCAGLDLPLAQDGGEFDVLYWVGCTAAFDPRAGAVARAFVELLRRAGVRVAVLGNDEPCCGDPARRIGHELLYDQFARSNIEILRSVAPRRITTACPHCLNALGTEYRAWGGDFDVVHHSALLAELVEQGRLAPVGPGADPDTITYHDPCYLGRYGGQFDAPRRLLDAAGATRVEMPRHRSSSFCCGGGGGQSWMPAGGPGEQRINVIRAREAAATGATTLAVSCPFCIRMLEDGVKAAGPEGEMRVRDVAEVLLDSLGPAATGSAPPRPGTSDPVRRAGDTRH